MKSFLVVAIFILSCVVVSSLKIKSLRLERFEVINGTIKFFSVRFTVTGLDKSKVKLDDAELPDDLFENKESQELAQLLSLETSKVLHYTETATKTLQTYFNGSSPIKANGQWLFNSFPKTDAIIIEDLDYSADGLTISARLFNL